MKKPKMKQPTSAKAEEVAKEYNARGVLILCFNQKTYKSVSYGITREECISLGKLLDQIADKVESGELSVWEARL